MNIKDISDKIYANTEDRERMEAMNDIYYEMADYIKSYNPGMYNEYYERACNILYDITEDEAKVIVRNMKPYGEHWNYDTVCSYVESMGEKPSVDYYLAMNMAYNDYHNAAMQFNMDTPEFYYAIARDFINDPDQKKHKIYNYFK